MNLIVVRAAYDPDAKVWWVEDSAPLWPRHRGSHDLRFRDGLAGSPVTGALR